MKFIANTETIRNLLSIVTRALSVRPSQPVLEGVLIEVRENCLLLTASDLSLKTVKEVAYLAGKHTLPHLPIPKTMEEIAGVIGKKTGVIGIADQGFADKLMLIHNETEEPNI